MVATPHAPATKVARSLLPLGIVVAALAATTWYLLTQGMDLGPWLLAAMLFAHGCVHLMFMFPNPNTTASTADGLDYPFDMDHSWLTRVGLEGDRVRGAGTVLTAAVFITGALAALATLGFLVPTEWWAPLVATSAAGSMLLLSLFFSPALLIGYAIDLALLWLVIGAVWSP